MNDKDDLGVEDLRKKKSYKESRNLERKREKKSIRGDDDYGRQYASSMVKSKIFFGKV